MIKEHSGYLEHPSNDMLRSAKILEDINGQKSNWPISSITVGLGVALFISLIMLNFLSKNFEISFFWQNQVPANKVLAENSGIVVGTGYEGPFFTESVPVIKSASTAETKLAVEASEQINFKDFSELKNGKSKYTRNDIEIASLYTESGIWPKVPFQSQPPSNVPLGDVYITSIDPSVVSLDAIALDKRTTGSELKALLDIRLPLAPSFEFLQG